MTSKFQPAQDPSDNFLLEMYKLQENEIKELKNEIEILQNKNKDLLLSIQGHKEINLQLLINSLEQANNLIKNFLQELNFLYFFIGLLTAILIFFIYINYSR
jgi:hypothetical protein